VLENLRPIVAVLLLSEAPLLQKKPFFKCRRNSSSVESRPVTISMLRCVKGSLSPARRTEEKKTPHPNAVLADDDKSPRITMLQENSGTTRSRPRDV
jgi:hypothetical protein